MYTIMRDELNQKNIFIEVWTANLAVSSYH